MNIQDKRAILIEAAIELKRRIDEILQNSPDGKPDWKQEPLNTYERQFTHLVCILSGKTVNQICEEHSDKEGDPQ
jgi:hypothetical protein